MQNQTVKKNITDCLDIAMYLIRNFKDINVKLLQIKPIPLDSRACRAKYRQP